MIDHTKTLLFIGLMLIVVLLVTSKPRATASTPIDGDEAIDKSQTYQSDIAPTWATNVPNFGGVPPLSLMIPDTGTQPAGGE